jgi:membrane-bound lytic murein transglycosylase D
MKGFAKIVFLLVSGTLLVGCASQRVAEKRPEKNVVIEKVPEQTPNREEAWNEKIKPLEQSIDSLRSQVAALEGRLKTMRTRPPLNAYQLPKEVSLCGERVPLEDREVWENLDREFLAALDNEAQVLLWIKRAQRYFPYIEKRLSETGLPDDLKYVAIVESSLRPYAVSSSGASGIWQFIPSTGERFGMRKNRVIDERFDLFKATDGALSYLKSLNDEFKNWALAMAAYNSGENRVRKEIDFQKTRDYYHLDLPMETERYVYKIAVAKVILSNPQKYGFSLAEHESYTPLLVDRVQIELTRPLPIMGVAQALGVFYKQIKEMNPHLMDENIPTGVHFLNLPPGTSERFWSFFSAWKMGMETK